MALKSGLAAQFGFATETTPGTAVAVTTFLPLLNETLDKEVERIVSDAIIAGRRSRTSGMWAPGRKMVTGSVETHLFNDDMAVLFEHMFGDASPPFTPGDRSGKSLTIQVGVPDTSGTVQPKTAAGAKFVGWELSCNVGEIAGLKLDVDAMHLWDHRAVADGVTNTDTSFSSATAAFGADDVGKPISGTNIASGTTIASVTSATAVVLSQASTGTGTGQATVIGIALASASYTSGLVPVTFRHGSVTIGGSAVKVKAATLTGAVALDVDRFALGQAYHDEALENGHFDVTAQLDLEFVDMTQWRRYLNGTEHALVLTFAVGSTHSLVITTNVRFDGVGAQVADMGLIRQNVPMVCVASGADSTAISAALTEPS